MTTRTLSLLRIRERYELDGSAAALEAARADYEAGRIDRLDIPEVLLALRAGSSALIEQLGRTPPGGVRLTALPA